jgi:hypothetical protein
MTLRQRRGGQGGNGGDAARLGGSRPRIAPPAAAPAHGVRKSASRRFGDHADRDFTLIDQADHHREFAGLAGEASRAVDGVDDPEAGGILHREANVLRSPQRFGRLFGAETVGRKCPFQAFQDNLLRAAIGLGGDIGRRIGNYFELRVVLQNGLTSLIHPIQGNFELALVVHSP